MSRNYKIITTRLMRRPSYRSAIAWIAENDEPGAMVARDVAYFISSLLVADMFGVEPERVGRDVVAYRRKHMGGE